MAKLKGKAKARARAQRKLDDKMDVAMAQFHYKSNTDDGVLFVMDDRIPHKVRIGMFDAIKKTVDLMRKEIDTNDYSKFEGVSNREEAFEWYTKQLEHWIPTYNMAVWGQPKHPDGIKTLRYNFHNESFLRSMIVIATNIWLLTLYQQIPNDQYNGTLFGYMAKAA